MSSLKNSLEGIQRDKWKFDAEFEADYYGMRLASAAGYNPAGGIVWLTKGEELVGRSRRLIKEVQQPVGSRTHPLVGILVA